MSVVRIGRLIVDVQRAMRRRQPRVAVYLLVYARCGGLAASIHLEPSR